MGSTKPAPRETSPSLELHLCRVLVAAIAATLAAASSSWAEVPIPSDCQVDTGGANDTGGARDIDRFCVARNETNAWNVFALIGFDETHLAASATSDACALYDTNADYNVDLAACVTIRSAGAAGDNLTVLDEVRLFTCDDSASASCGAAALLPAPYDSYCELAHADSDPFGPALLAGLGDEYPFDTQVACSIDLGDFGLAAPEQRLLDACSYPAHTPDAPAADCILASACSGAAACDDGNDCTTDACLDGECRHTAESGAPCSDGLFCNGEETCDTLGFCPAGTVPLNCDDGWGCTVDWCDEWMDTCVNDPRDSLCSDDDFCNGVESCQPVVAGARESWGRSATRGQDDACVAGFAPDCDDGVACTVDSCDTAGGCRHVADDAACSDGSACNGTETCDPIAGCLSGASVDCDDGVGCTADSCAEPSGACAHLADDPACSDDVFCNGAETCDAAAGCSRGPAPDCDDAIDCTLDACDESTAGCSHQPLPAACSDGVFCNGVETCDPGTGCRPGEVPCNGPAVCSEVSDSCVGCINDADCSNGVYCDGVETCETSTGTCRAGAVASCIDAIGCTIDSCDEYGDRCVHTPNAAACEDGLFCNGAETCDATLGCVAGPARTCDDGIACTADRCVEATDTCSHVADDAACDDGRFCNGAEVCDPTIGCDSGEAPACPGDHLNCSIERCDETRDSCRSDLSRCTCGDREIVAPEECDPPTRAGTFEDCNNGIDDDRDLLVDCADLDCQPGAARGGVCDENCRIDQLCKRVESDPAAIVFHSAGGPSSFWVHGRFVLKGEADPVADGFTIRISNEIQPIFAASLGAGDLTGDDAGRRFAWSDRTARLLGNTSSRGGLGRVQLRIREYSGVRYLTFRVQAWGDFSAATERTMRTEVEVGDEVASLNAQWKPTPKSWLLHQHEF